MNEKGGIVPVNNPITIIIEAITRTTLATLLKGSGTATSPRPQYNNQKIRPQITNDKSITRNSINL